MFLDSTLMKLEGVLAAAADPAPVFHVGYVVHSVSGALSKPALSRGAFNGSNDVTLLAAPGTAGEVREVLYASIYNNDDIGITITIKTDDGTTERIIFRKAIGAGEALQYTRQNGWYREAVV